MRHAHQRVELHKSRKLFRGLRQNLSLERAVLIHTEYKTNAAFLYLPSYIIQYSSHPPPTLCNGEVKNHPAYLYIAAIAPTRQCTQNGSFECVHNGSFGYTSVCPSHKHYFHKSSGVGKWVKRLGRQVQIFDKRVGLGRQVQYFDKWVGLGRRWLRNSFVGGNSP